MKIFSVVILLSILGLPTMSFAGSKDTVTYVYACGDDVGIKMQNSGWVVAKQSEIGAKRVDRIMTVALTLLTTGKPTGYFDDVRGTIYWCGVNNVKPIKVLGIMSE